MKRGKGWTPKQIKQLRKKLDLTQKEFAERLGVHVVTIIRWEGGSFKPSKMAMTVLNSLNQ
jgi:DNA-binding transcriptional regulator YiaG